MPKYPEITIQLTGEDGNAFAILNRCTVALKKAKLREEVETFRKQATRGDYDNLISTVFEWFSVE